MTKGSHSTTEPTEAKTQVQVLFRSLVGVVLAISAVVAYLLMQFAKSMGASDIGAVVVAVSAFLLGFCAFMLVALYFSSQKRRAGK